MKSAKGKKKLDFLGKLAAPNERVYPSMLLKEQFLSVRVAKNWQTTQNPLKHWIVVAMKSKIHTFVELGNKFFRKRHFVLNYFI